MIELTEDEIKAIIQETLRLAPGPKMTYDDFNAEMGIQAKVAIFAFVRGMQSLGYKIERP